MTLGIVGGGQLGKMLAEAAVKIGVDTVVLETSADCPAAKVTRHIEGAFSDHDAVKAFANEADVLTFEIESANAEALQELVAEGYPVHPTPETLSIIKDKLRQKTLFKERGIPLGPFMDVPDEEAAKAAGTAFGYPFVLKARSGGYDGRGNVTVKTEADIPAAFLKLGSARLYAEAFVPFEKELAVVAVRTTGGEIRTYPVVETIHENHICMTVMAPAPVEVSVREKAEVVATNVLESFEGAGVFGIELFLVGNEVLVNEVAPRVHNSGHFTIEGSVTSQFENHVRAVTDMPLGDTAMKHPVAVMINILGDRTGPADPQGIAAAEALGATVHIYGKKETKPARKMGHLTCVGDTLEEVLERAKKARASVSI